MIENHALNRMRAGKAAIGFGAHHLRSMATPLLAEAAGYHWLFIDCEHGAHSIQEATQLAIASLATSVTPIVRVCKGALDEATRALDNGAMGLLIPHIDTRAEAEALVAAVKFPPLGHRSMGGPPAQARFSAMPAGEMMAAMNRNLMTCVMIETPIAVANIPEIAAVEGVDALMIGTSDLTAEMGIPGQAGHEKVAEAYRIMTYECARLGKFAGMGGIYDEVHAAAYLKMGVRFVLGGSDHGLLLQAAKARAEFLAGLPLS
ncbi:MAG: aldolase [Acetobacteraceae bacterium]|nr:aldolase [Acetobacteraceae bacterium]